MLSAILYFCVTLLLTGTLLLGLAIMAKARGAGVVAIVFPSLFVLSAVVGTAYLNHVVVVVVGEEDEDGGGGGGGRRRRSVEPFGDVESKGERKGDGGMSLDSCDEVLEVESGYATRR